MRIIENIDHREHCVSLILNSLKVKFLNNLRILSHNFSFIHNKFFFSIISSTCEMHNINLDEQSRLYF